MKGARIWLLGVMVVLLGALLAACGGDDPTATPTTPAAATPTAVSSVFEQLVERARGESHVIRMGLEGQDPEVIRTWESAFEAQFGFPVILESEPGHASREVPLKVSQAAEAGRGIVDVLSGDINNNLPLLVKGHMRRPDFAVLEEGFPIIKQLRTHVPAFAAPDGTTYKDTCLISSTAPWAMAYNTDNLTAEEVASLAGIKWDTLTEPQWKDRVVWDARALGLFNFPFAPGWDEQRLADFSQNLGANGLKLIPGGSNGVIQAIIQGEGDVGVVSLGVTQRNKLAGAPVDFAFPEFFATPITLHCLPKFGVNNNPNMALLYLGWHNTDGAYAVDHLGAGGFRLYPEEAEKFEINAIAAAAGVTADSLVHARTAEEADATGDYRQIAIDGMQKGIQTGERATP